MKISHGTVFVFQNDRLPNGVSITGATVVMEVPSGTNLEGFITFLSERTSGSIFEHNSFISLEDWAALQVEESINKVRTMCASSQ